MKRWHYALGLIFLICLVGVIVHLSTRPGLTARLPNGATLRLLGVSAGTNHFWSDLRVYAVLRKVTPRKYQRWIPEPIQGSCGYSNTVTVWLQLVDPVHHTNVVQQWGRFETVGEKGEILPGYGTQRSEPRYFACVLETFPRRDKSFLLRVYDTNQQLAATLRVQNPYRGPWPEWKPDPLPVTRTNGELAVTFKGIEKIWEEVQTGKTSTWYFPQFEYKWQGVPTSNWWPTQYRVEDPMGNLGGV